MIALTLSGWIVAVGCGLAWFHAEDRAEKFEIKARSRRDGGRHG